MSTRPWTTSATEPAGQTDLHAVGWRAAWLLLGIWMFLGAVLGRVVWLQQTRTESFLAGLRAEVVEEQTLAVPDGRLMTRDGVLLATDEPQYRIEVHYRWLEDPPHEQWLHDEALRRLDRAERRDPAKVAAAEAMVLEQRDQLWQRLSEWTGLEADQLRARRERIQNRVEAMVARVREHRSTPPAERPVMDARDWRSRVAQWLQPAALPPARRGWAPLAEELGFHAVIVGAPAAAAQYLESHPELVPAARVATEQRRVYPQQAAAAHLWGSRRKDNAAAPTRIAAGGLEEHYDAELRGTPGRLRIVKNQAGEVIRRETLQHPQPGRDVQVELDWSLQVLAEDLLDQAIDRAEDPAPTGGSLVALDVETGAVVTLATAPRYDANLLVTPDDGQWRALESDARRPFFHRATQMAIPPGSVFKVCTALAALDAGVSPHDAIDCAGYLETPERHRCLSYRHQGVGHGVTRLTDALCRSCNVYFYRMGRKVGPHAICAWAHRLGLGEATGIDLPSEAAGAVPVPATKSTRGNAWMPGETLNLAIGQSRLQTTPLQMARLMAAVANGGRLVTPRLVRDPQEVAVASEIGGLDANWLDAVREGLEQVVNHPTGTASKTVRLPQVRIAGKTGTAETGGNRPDHAWFAGYAPAEAPRYALVVVLEHGGSGGRQAGPLAREYLQALFVRHGHSAPNVLETATVEHE